LTWFDVRQGNPLKALLKNGGPAIGIFVRMPSLEVVEMCGHAGCDFIIIDAEHGPLSWERVAAMVVAAENVGTTPLLRVSNGTRDLISRGLDAGAHGVMVPQVESIEMAQAAVTATRYGPEGTRGTAGSSRNGFGMVMGYAEYVPAANDAVLVVLQIETVAGVESVKEVAGIEGVDCIFIGLTDLSVSLGHPGEYGHPEVEEHVDRIFDAATKHGVPVGVPVTDPSMAESYLERGARFVATGDTGIFGRGVRSFVEGVRESSA